MTTVRGLQDVIASDTAVGFIDGTATPSILEYRGYAAADLGQHASFEEVAHLLIVGALPTGPELTELRWRLAGQRALGEPEVDLIRRLAPEGHSMDVLMATIVHAHARGVLASSDDLRATALELTALLPTIVATYYRSRNGLEPITPDPSKPHAANYLRMLQGEAAPEVVRALDCLLTLYAEHELNASTFTVRVAASTGTDYHSAIVAGMAALKGPLHGGATEDAIQLLLEVGSPERAEAWVDQALAEKRLIPGFGHRVYRSGDARTPILRDLCLVIADSNEAELINVAAALERYLGDRKGLIANVDLYAAALMNFIGFPPDMLTAVVASSRVTGWSAHAIEQYEDNRIIRPRARYTGVHGRCYTAPQSV